MGSSLDCNVKGWFVFAKQVIVDSTPHSLLDRRLFGDGSSHAGLRITKQTDVNWWTWIYESAHNYQWLTQLLCYGGWAVEVYSWTHMQSRIIYLSPISGGKTKLLLDPNTKRNPKLCLIIIFFMDLWIFQWIPTLLLSWHFNEQQPISHGWLITEDINLYTVAWLTPTYIGVDWHQSRSTSGVDWSIWCR